MDYRRNVTQGLNPIASLTDIATHHFDTMFLKQGTQFGYLIRTMDLRAQIVHQPHLYAALDECPGKRQADEPEPPCNQDLLGHSLILTCLVSMARVSIRLVCDS